MTLSLENSKSLKENSFFSKIYKFVAKHRRLSLFSCGLLFATPFMLEWLFPFTFISLCLFFLILDTEKHTLEKDCKRFLFPFFRKRNNDVAKGIFSQYFFFFLGCNLFVYTLFFKLYPFEGFDYLLKLSFGCV